MFVHSLLLFIIVFDISALGRNAQNLGTYLHHKQSISLLIMHTSRQYYIILHIRIGLVAWLNVHH